MKKRPNRRPTIWDRRVFKQDLLQILHPIGLICGQVLGIPMKRLLKKVLRIPHQIYDFGREPDMRDFGENGQVEEHN